MSYYRSVFQPNTHHGTVCVYNRYLNLSLSVYQYICLYLTHHTWWTVSAYLRFSRFWGSALKRQKKFVRPLSNSIFGIHVIQCDRVFELISVQYDLWQNARTSTWKHWGNNIILDCHYVSLFLPIHMYRGSNILLYLLPQAPTTSFVWGFHALGQPWHKLAECWRLYSTMKPESSSSPFSYWAFRSN